MPRILLLATTTGYQTRAFGDAAERLGVELVFATDRCHVIDDPWQDAAIPIRFYDEEASVTAIVDASRHRRIDGILVVGDRPTVIAARVAEALGLPGHPPAAAAIARNKQLSRERLREAGLPAPWFQIAPVTADPSAIVPSVGFPCVVKPLALSGSRGVMRADDPASFRDAVLRLRALLQSPDIRAERSDAHQTLLVEEFIPGRELALEAVLHHGALHAMALFDKPDPLDGPFFEETIYLTPSSLPAGDRDAVVDAVTRAAVAIGLTHGPIHAECRVNEEGVFVLEVAARPIGGLCSRALRFVQGDGSRLEGDGSRLEGDGRPYGKDSRPPYTDSRPPISLEELLLRHALGESPAVWRRETPAAGVMMIPIPRRGVFRGVEGLDDARRVDGIEDIRITAKEDQLLVPLPEGASYLGFIFGRAADAHAVDRALRAAHARLRFAVDSELPVVQSRHG
jgi:formate-dependent phosphoribosylglycinamide formyltransferase (GAR transformylase)